MAPEPAAGLNATALASGRPAADTRQVTSPHDAPRRDRSVPELLARAHCLLLDFDGPVCRLFHTRSAMSIATLLRELLAARGAPVVDEALLRSSDPHAILRAAPSAELAAELELLLAEEEELAALGAESTPHADDFIQAVADSGRSLAMTTNNAPGAVRAYLKEHRLDGCFGDAVFGRDPVRPELMKPDPHCLRAACAALAVRPQDCLMIGDSAADARAAAAAGVPFLGYARVGEDGRRLGAGYRGPLVHGMERLEEAARALPRR